ncbi:3847_t:CDS:1, partial [Rhizophagus irregularis]
ELVSPTRFYSRVIHLTGLDCSRISMNWQSIHGVVQYLQSSLHEAEKLVEMITEMDQL